MKKDFKVNLQSIVKPPEIEHQKKSLIEEIREIQKNEIRATSNYTRKYSREIQRAINFNKKSKGYKPNVAEIFSAKILKDAMKEPKS